MTPSELKTTSTKTTPTHGDTAEIYNGFICGYVIYDNPNYNPDDESSGGKYWGDPPHHTNNRI